MELFYMSIKKIFSVKENKRTVWVDFIRDFYDGPTRMACGFLKAEWPQISHDMQYLETKALDEDGVKYFENMEDGEWYARHFATRLKDFSDEEIVEEFNRRMEHPFHRITITGKAAIKKA